MLILCSSDTLHVHDLISKHGRIFLLTWKSVYIMHVASLSSLFLSRKILKDTENLTYDSSPLLTYVGKKTYMYLHIKYSVVSTG